MNADRPLLPLKVCGLMRPEDVQLCLDLGASFTGFIFAPGSPRRISPEQAAALPSGKAARVGVFAGQDVDTVRAVMHAARLDYAQLHGGEDEDFCRAIGPKRVIKVLWPERLAAADAGPQALREALERECARFAPVCALFLLDAGQRGGGSGQALPWPLLREFSPPRPWILAGGLGPDNLPEALAACSPHAVDCNSGLESAPGVKDPEKLRAAAGLLATGLLPRDASGGRGSAPDPAGGNDFPRSPSVFVTGALVHKNRPHENTTIQHPQETPMKKGYFGEFGGQFVPELLMPPLRELEEACETVLPGAAFQEELNDLLATYAGRTTPLTRCPALSERLGFTLWLKREDLLHTGAHKINNTLGQALLARHMGKTALVAETGAGQHGVATAAAAARLGLSCSVFMGAEDVERQAPNVMRMRLLGADVRPVHSGTKTLKDAINEALRFWIAHQADTHYCFGTAAGPHPFPTLVRDLQSVIGEETMAQCREAFGALPDAVAACVGGGSNAIGMFYPFVRESAAAGVRLIGVEAGGTGEPGCYSSAPLNLGSPGVLHGHYTMLLQDSHGQILPSHSVSAGLDYPGVGPEHAQLHASGRVEYRIVNDSRALAAFAALCRTEGILPALESSHALAWVLDNAEDLPQNGNVVVNLSGRGDKDMDIIRRHLPELCAQETAR